MSERLKIAVFIDFDNIEIGVKTTLGAHFDIGAILEAIKERGEVITKIAYGDWKRAGDHSRVLTQHAIRMVQRNVTPGGDKNGADINLALDALEMALTHEHINAYVIVGGDSDFISLVEKLKQYDKKVFVVGGRAFTSAIMQKNCYEFIAYENLITPPTPSRRAAREKDRGAGDRLSKAVPLVARALQVLSDREVSPQLGLLKSTLLQLDSAFSERDYGAGSFREFVEKLSQAGFVNLKQAGRSVLVELNEGDAKGAQEVVAEAPAEGNGHPAAEAPAAATSSAAEQRVAEPPREEAKPKAAGAEQPVAPPEQAGTPVEAVHAVRRMFESGFERVRWPMYVRNVKQFLRAGDAGFDERRHGFGGILDLLRACQREGVFRLERDRQGVLRVFPGAALQRPSPAAAAGAGGAAATPEVMAEPEPAPVVVEAEAVAAPAEGTEAATGAREAAGAEAAAAVQEGAPGAEAQPGKPKRRRGGGGARKTASGAAGGTKKTTKTAVRPRAPRKRAPAAPKP